MNERNSFFCRISTLAPLHGADGAYRDTAGCHTVSPTPVDWIIGYARSGSAATSATPRPSRAGSATTT